MEVQLNYSDFISITNAKSLLLQHSELNTQFDIWATEYSVCYKTTIYKPEATQGWINRVQEAANLLDYLTNYAPTANQAVTPKTITQPDNNFMLNADGIMADVPVGSTGYNIDYRVFNTAVGNTGSLWLSGCEYWTSGASMGDWCEFKIMDLDNVLGMGSGVTLKQYVIKRFVCCDHVHTIKANAPGEVPNGLYLRVVYHSIGKDQNPMFVINYDLNIKDPN